MDTVFLKQVEALSPYRVYLKRTQAYSMIAPLQKYRTIELYRKIFAVIIIYYIGPKNKMKYSYLKFYLYSLVGPWLKLLGEDSNLLDQTDRYVTQTRNNVKLYNFNYDTLRHIIYY